MHILKLDCTWKVSKVQATWDSEDTWDRGNEERYINHQIAENVSEGKWTKQNMDKFSLKRNQNWY